MNKIPLLGKTLNELTGIATSLGMPSYTGKQLAEWIYRKRVVSIDEMSNISVKNRALLQEQYEVGRTQPVERQVSIDGTIKYLFKTHKNQFIESVFIPQIIKSSYEGILEGIICFFKSTNIGDKNNRIVFYCFFQH